MGRIDVVSQQRLAKTAALMLCADPARWGEGYRRAVLLAVAAADELASVEWLEAPIESAIDRARKRNCRFARGALSLERSTLLHSTGPALSTPSGRSGSSLRLQGSGGRRIALANQRSGNAERRTGASQCGAPAGAPIGSARWCWPWARSSTLSTLHSPSWRPRVQYRQSRRSPPSVRRPRSSSA